MRHRKDEREERKRRSYERGRKTDKHAERRRDALPALELHVWSQHVAKHAHHADRKGKPRNVRCEIPRGNRREKPLQDVARKRENTPLLADGAKDVRRADVLRPDSANVDATHLADEKAERNSPDEIGDDKPGSYDDACLHR